METTDHRIRPKSCRRHGLDRNPHLLLLLWLLFLLLLLLYELVARTADPVDLQAILFGVGASAAHARHPRLQAAQLRQFGVRIALADRAALTALAVSRPAVAIRRTAGRQRCSSKGRERAKRERKGQRGERRLRRPLLGTLPSLVFLYVDRFDDDGVGRFVGRRFDSTTGQANEQHPADGRLRLHVVDASRDELGGRNEAEPDQVRAVDRERERGTKKGNTRAWL